MPTERELLERWERLTFTDDFIFSQVIRNKRLCRTACYAPSFYLPGFLGAGSPQAVLGKEGVLGGGKPRFRAAGFLHNFYEGNPLAVCKKVREPTDSALWRNLLVLV